MKELICSNPFFGIALTALSYGVGIFINRLTKKDYVSPLLIAFLLIILVLLLFDIPITYYDVGGSMISMFNVPIVALLSLKIWRERGKVKANFVPIIIGTIVGSIASIGSVLLMCWALNVEPVVRASVISKSVTAPIALAITDNLGGIGGITMFSVLITGILGSVLSPVMVKFLKIKDHMAEGVAIGTASHALGTAKALEMGEDIGAASGIAMSFAGLITVGLSLFLI